ncbi:hypothetical protein ET495_08990 [Xylanimonas allomyrinae]|uniref:DUF2142 domain-containing protein n=1 Tax=Xylanimonas allomyrinae TaxID=2509459 RepID=A0A4P6EKX2_9MICO|nr:hypothetical protein [Xylanimonas allomyrinae]QAY63360.1 hypothetical protein ET495_08990 [Xylanimonas allomyrinae]
MPDSAATGGLPRIRRAGVPAAVWLVVLLQVTVCLLQTAVFPNGRSPDEAKQVDLVVQVAEGTAWPWPSPGTLATTAGVRAGAVLPPDRLHGAAHLADRDFRPRGERPSWAQAGGAAPWLADGAPLNNQLVQHPPLYYVLGAAVVQAVPGWHDLPFDRVWMVLRWVNILLAAPLPLLAWATARRLRLPDPLPLAAAGAVVAIPELTHIASSVNNDNLLVLLGAAATWLVARVLTGDHTARTALALGGVTSLALATKGFALLLPAWVAAAYAAAWWHGRRTRGSAHGTLAASLWALAAMLPGLSWWARNLVLFGALQPHGTHADQGYLQSGERYTWADGGAAWLHRLVDRLITLFFVQDQAAHLRHDASWWASRAGLAALAVGIGVALVRGPLRRLDALVLLAPAAALTAIVAKGSYEQFVAFRNLGAAQQGRYLYLAVVAIVVVAVAGAVRARRWAPAIVLVLGLGLHAAFQADAWAVLWLPEGPGSPAAIGAAAGAMVRLHPFGWAALGPAAIVTTAGLAVATAVAVSQIRRRGA